eukprot:5431430-Pyramimonas_sp.AAC.1
MSAGWGRGRGNPAPRGGSCESKLHLGLTNKHGHGGLAISDSAVTSVWQGWLGLSPFQFAQIPKARQGHGIFTFSV